MIRVILTCLCVALLSGWISGFQQVQDERPAEGRIEWIRTVDGWEDRAVVDLPRTNHEAALHPLVVAGVQLSGSLLVLMAFPSLATPVATRHTSKVPHRPAQHVRRAVASVGG